MILICVFCLQQRQLSGTWLIFAGACGLSGLILSDTVIIPRIALICFVLSVFNIDQFWSLLESPDWDSKQNEDQQDCDQIVGEQWTVIGILLHLNCAFSQDYCLWYYLAVWTFKIIWTLAYSIDTDTSILTLACTFNNFSTRDTHIGTIALFALLSLPQDLQNATITG